MLNRLALFFLCFLAHSLHAQEEVQADSSKIHSVKKATVFSAVLPGAGQVYNHLAMPKGKKKAFWKVPLIYAGLGATGYFLIQEQSTQRALKKEYSYRIDNGVPSNPDYLQYDNEGVLFLYREHLNRRDMFLIATALVYGIQVADAAVEAHFVRFDISEDLSLQIRPKLHAYNQAGISFSLKIH
jgi:hypothetical protein